MLREHDSAATSAQAAYRGFVVRSLRFGINQQTVSCSLLQPASLHEETIEVWRWHLVAEVHDRRAFRDDLRDIGNDSDAYR